MLDITGTTMDAKLALMIKQVSARIATFLGYSVARATYTDELRAVNNQQILYLRECPIQTVSAVTIDGVAVTDYQVLSEYSKFGGLYLGIGWSGRYFTRGMTYDPVAGYYDVKATYTAGWYLPGDTGYVEGAAASVPLDIQNAAMQGVIEWYRINALEAEGLKAHSEGGMSDTFGGQDSTENNPASGLSRAVIQMLTPYQRIGVA
jgi:hypothetical protein